MTDRQPPNYHDDACGYGHAAHSPDVAGSLFGLRGWALTNDGWLRGATYRAAWANGWNTAACLVARRTDDVKTPRPGFRSVFWNAMHDANSGVLFPLTPDEPITYEDGWAGDPCRGLDPKCGCGFYGYYDAQTGRTNAYGNIRGVIEATGKTVVGPKGFRAQRARIVAVVRPTNFQPRLSGIEQREVNSLKAAIQVVRNTRKDLRLRPWFCDTNTFAVLWGTCVVALGIIGTGAGDRAALLGSASLTLSLIGALTWVARRRTRHIMAGLDSMADYYQQQVDEITAAVDLDQLMTLLAEHYPDVKVYPTMSALIEDYPPSDVRGLLGLDFTPKAEDDDQ